MIQRHSPGSTRRLTLGADKGYDAAEFVADLRHACVTPHVAQKSRYSAVDGRTTRHEGYALSIKRRKRIEEAFGWAKTVGDMAQTVYRGVERVRSRFISKLTAGAVLMDLLGCGYRVSLWTHTKTPPAFKFCRSQILVAAVAGRMTKRFGSLEKAIATA
jgi:hypothetical protein